MSDTEKIDKLKLLLKELFQFDNSDLDFGIYRIINIKRKEISEFIDKELFDIINEKIKTLGDNSELKKTVYSLRLEIEESFGCNINEAKTKYPETPKVKNYIDKEKELKAVEKETEIEGEIYDDIINFFSRYYDKGDFISKRRYSKDNKYAIPYNGEEVYLYWANNDQYYIKTGENFNNYSFKTGNLKVSFEIAPEEIEVEKGNIKDPEKKFFIFHDADYDANKKLVSALFGYRGLTEEETKNIQALTEKKNIGKDEVNTYNLKKINEKIALFGLSDLQKKHTKMDGEKSDKSELEWHLNKYTTKNTTDYFIHKNLKRFLSQELDFFIKNEIIHIDDIGSKEGIEINVNKIKAFKDICLKIIDFLSQVEDFQKLLWEKKKFVISTDYCITLGYVPEKHYPKILENKAQLLEWGKLYSFDIEKEAGLLKGKLTAQGKSEAERKIEVLKQNPTLVIDTKFYDEDFKYQLLSEIEDLDEKTNGILINSENFQALNLLMNKYREKIKCCYIDPPYNTERDRELRKFIYKDGFNESSWLSMMEGRLILSRNILTNDSVIFNSIDDNELQNLRVLFDYIFGFENRLDRGVFIWENKGSTKGFRRIVKNHEYILAYSNNPENVESVYGLNYPEEMIIDEINERLQIKRSPKNPVDTIKFPKGLRIDDQINIIFNDSIGNGTNKIDIISNDKKMIFQNGKLIHDVLLEASFPYKEQMIEFFSKMDTNEKTYDTKGQEWLEVYFTKTGVPYHRKLRKTRIASSLIQDVSNSGLKDLEKFGIYGFDNPKPVSLIQYLLKYFTSKEDIVLDYFAGSGTTGESVILTNKNDKNNRKFILVEMAEYFDTVMKPRILKVIYSDNWKEGTPLDNKGSKKQIIKYQTLEQYEDSLNNIDFIEPNVIAKESKDYKIKYMLEFESKGSKVLLNIDALDNPFDYKLKFEENNELKEKSIDLVETFNYLAGITVKSIKKIVNGTITYIIVKGYRNEKDVIVIWRNKPDGFDPLKDKDFIEKEILKDDYDEILVNGNSLVKDAKSIDEIFKTNMFG